MFEKGGARGGWGAGGNFAVGGALVLALRGLGAVILGMGAGGVHFHFRVTIRVDSRKLAKRIPIDIVRSAHSKGRYWGPNIPPWPLACRRGFRGPYKVRKPSGFWPFKKIVSEQHKS